MTTQTARPFLCAASLLLLAGCWTYGTKFTQDQVRQLKPGMTVDEVEAIMGPPNSMMAGTVTRATWVYATALGAVNSLNLVFGADGRLTAVPGSATPAQAPSLLGHADQLKAGMTMEQVTAIIGPPDQATAGIPAVDPATGQTTGSQTIATWVAPPGTPGLKALTLMFGPDGRVTSIPPLPHS